MCIMMIFLWLLTLKYAHFSHQGHSSLHPGQSWCFSGARGHLFISLSHSVCITHVTLGHITKSQSPDRYITSAPRNFSVYVSTTFLTYILAWNVLCIIITVSQTGANLSGNEFHRGGRNQLRDVYLQSGWCSISDLRSVCKSVYILNRYCFNCLFNSSLSYRVSTSTSSDMWNYRLKATGETQTTPASIVLGFMVNSMWMSTV